MGGWGMVATCDIAAGETVWNGQTFIVDGNSVQYVALGFAHSPTGGKNFTPPYTIVYDVADMKRASVPSTHANATRIFFGFTFAVDSLGVNAVASQSAQQFSIMTIAGIT